MRFAWYVLVAFEVALMMLMWVGTADAWVEGGVAPGIVATLITGSTCAFAAFMLREIKRELGS